MNHKLTVLAAMFAASSVPGLAGGITLETKVLKTEAFKLPDGSTTERQVAAQKAVPGDPMVYVLAYRNTGTTPVADIVLNSPVPATMVYRGAGAGADAEVSIDGVHFARLADLSVTGPGGVRRAARLSDVTNVRWKIATPIPAGAMGEVSFHAALR